MVQAAARQAASEGGEAAGSESSGPRKRAQIGNVDNLFAALREKADADAIESVPGAPRPRPKAPVTEGLQGGKEGGVALSPPHCRLSTNISSRFCKTKPEPATVEELMGKPVLDRKMRVRMPSMHDVRDSSDLLRKVRHNLPRNPPSILTSPHRTPECPPLSKGERRGSAGGGSSERTNF